MTSTKERKTATITIKVTPEFKKELVEFADYNHSSQTVILEQSFNNYVQYVIKLAVDRDLERLAEIGIPDDQIKEMYHKISRIWDLPNLRSILHPDTFSDEMLLELITKCIKKGEDTGFL